MHDKATGYVFVGFQVVLLLGLILPTTGNDWLVSGGLRFGGLALIVGGLCLAGIASGKLGAALTATPVPNGRGSLRTDGLYRLVRHPIYSGVLLIVIGLVLRSGRWLVAAVGVATISFFHTKAKWEEQKLREHFPEYDAYARITPRFLPRLGKVLGGDSKA